MSQAASPQAILDQALALPATTLSVQWGDAQVIKVGGRIFAIIGADGGLSFKARPAPYLARAKWVRFDDPTALNLADTADWLATAHALVAAKLTRAQRRELGLS